MLEAEFTAAWMAGLGDLKKKNSNIIETTAL
jgi:hypothetical protein